MSNRIISIEELDDLPAYSTDLIDLLETLFQPRCMGLSEKPEVHHRYAGKVELTQSLAELRDYSVYGDDE